MTVYSGEYIEGLETRIRELEEKLKDCQQTVFHLQRDQERMGKARQILAALITKHEVCGCNLKRGDKYTAQEVNHVLEALEGK